MAGRRTTPESMSIALPDGTELDMAIRPHEGTESIEVRTLGPITPHNFDECPICGEPATTAEHVPPAAIGGLRTTRTCEPCNNRLGALVEPDFIAWVEGALLLPAFSGDAIRGPRYPGRLLHRATPNAEPVFIISIADDDPIGELLASGTANLTATVPDENRKRLGALKHAYLAACLHTRAIPAGSDQVRTELLAARAAKTRDDVPYSPVAAGLKILRIDPAGEAPHRTRSSRPSHTSTARKCPAYSSAGPRSCPGSAPPDRTRRSPGRTG